MLFDLSSLVPNTPQVGEVSDRTFDPLQMISHLFQEMALGSDGCRQALCKVNNIHVIEIMQNVCIVQIYMDVIFFIF